MQKLEQTKNSITITINKPIDEVFKFTTNPAKTHLWIPSIKKEVADNYPPAVGTIYKNCGEDGQWDTYKVTEFIDNQLFTLSDLENNYNVRYSYHPINDQQTEMTYFEWVNEGALSNPFTEDIIGNLKLVLES
ncbi:hypothetical protein CR969_01060 [Candidatus Saccharibacteria bacterium]|nr:MAG: hypothetical protein CR969_01060 [Candidatus Saccharibacteria bacterium]